MKQQPDDFTVGNFTQNTAIELYKLNDALLSLSQLIELTQCSRSTIYRLMNDGNMPKNIKLGRGNRWKRTEIQSWLNGLSSDTGAANELK